MKQFTTDEMRAYVQDKYEGAHPSPEAVRSMLNRWLARGDGVAVYENHDFGHPMMGEPKIASYGSPSALLEAEEPPERLPDTPTQINWRYMLVATYRGEVL